MKTSRLSHCFVDGFPNDPEEGTLYISIKFRSAMHLCCCGCGNEIATPIRPTDWAFTYDGESISLHPSIGNWSLPCRSHYWIKNGTVIEAPSWSKGEIERGRIYDINKKTDYYNASTVAKEKKGNSLWEKIKRIFQR